ncbi:hypothetical protein BaRGS_00016920 [Batillaria attramentaria]|uniref:Uncharacterized protein n=1 Tax=Batillaria attramentaria TaxID=370345 RepID=A0ABD0KY06_9CAEN
MRLLVIILLAASIWTVAAKEVVVAEVIDAPSIQELYLFDISTRSSQPGTLKQAFWDVDVIVHNSLKVTGKRRHLFIVEDSGTLRDVNLPEDADVTVYPVEHLSDYMTLFDTEFGNPELGPLPDENLTLVERTWFAEGWN